MTSETRVQGALLPDSVLAGPDLSDGYSLTASVAPYLSPGRYGDVLFEKIEGVTGTTAGATVSWFEGEVDTLDAGRLYLLEVAAERDVDDKPRKLQGLIYIRAAASTGDADDVFLDGGGA